MVEMPAFLPNFIRYNLDPVRLIVVLVIQLICVGLIIIGITLTATGKLSPGGGPGGTSAAQFGLIAFPAILAGALYFVMPNLSVNTPEEMELFRSMGQVNKVAADKEATV